MIASQQDSWFQNITTVFRQRKKKVENNGSSRKKLGIVLSGGGARGIAHIGVLRALGEYGIFPDIVAGSSMGAIVGAMYAAGKTYEEMEELIGQIRSHKIIRMGLPFGGLTDLTYLKNMVKQNVSDDSFEALQKPLYVCVSNLNTGHYEIINSGKLSSAIMASSAIPLIFKPVKINDQSYVDGGVLNNMPVEAIRDLCDMVIGVNVNPNTVENKVSSMLGIGERIFDMHMAENVKSRISQCDVVIEIPNALEYNIFDFKRGNLMVEFGYNDTLRKIPEIAEKARLTFRE